jgi:hypothetical protein
MESTINNGFEALRRYLEITGLQEATVSARQTNVREAVATQMKVLDSFLTGSYRRSTMIGPLKDADVDIFVVMDPQYHDARGQRSLLDRVKYALAKTYTASDISRNGQAVTMYFSDFRVDVVPAFYRTGGGFLIPDSPAQRWIETNPKIHVEAMSESNKLHSGNLVPLVKMVKVWNRSNGETLRSFHLEMLVRHVATGHTIEAWSTSLLHVFRNMKALIGKTLFDPAGFGDPIGSYIDTYEKAQAVVSRLTTAESRVEAAIDLGHRNKIREAFEKWQLVFGEYYFPAYG